MASLADLARLRRASQAAQKPPTANPEPAPAPERVPPPARSQEPTQAPPGVRRVVIPAKLPDGKCACCGKPAKLWVQVVTRGVRWHFNRDEYDGPQPEAVCTRACAQEIADSRGDVWPGKKTEVVVLDVR